MYMQTDAQNTNTQQLVDTAFDTQTSSCDQPMSEQANTDMIDNVHTGHNGKIQFHIAGQNINDASVAKSGSNLRPTLKVFGPKSNFQILLNLARKCKGEMKWFKCTYCLKTYKSKVISLKQLSFNLPNKIYSCGFCKATFKRFSLYQQHVNSHEVQTVLKCQSPRCKCILTKRSSLKRHLQRHETIDKMDQQSLMRQVPEHSNQPKRHICVYCGLSYIHLGRLKSHMRKHIQPTSTNTQQHVDVCNHFNSVEVNTDLIENVHNADYIHEIPFQIPDQSTDISFNQQKLNRNLPGSTSTTTRNPCSNLKVSVSESTTNTSSTSTVIKPITKLQRFVEAGGTEFSTFKCSFSQKLLSKNFSSLQQKLNHPETKPYEYPYQDCKEALPPRNHLKRHLCEHKTKASLCCRSCFKCFEKKSSLLKHIIHHRKMNGKMYLCQHCGIFFIQKNTLASHLKMHAHRESPLPNSQLQVHQQNDHHPQFVKHYGKCYTKQTRSSTHFQTEAQPQMQLVQQTNPQSEIHRKNDQVVTKQPAKSFTRKTKLPRNSQAQAQPQPRFTYRDFCYNATESSPQFEVYQENNYVVTKQLPLVQYGPKNYTKGLTTPSTHFQTRAQSEAPVTHQNLDKNMHQTNSQFEIHQQNNHTVTNQQELIQNPADNVDHTGVVEFMREVLERKGHYGLERQQLDHKQPFQHSKLISNLAHSFGVSDLIVSRFSSMLWHLSLNQQKLEPNKVYTYRTTLGKLGNNIDMQE